MIRPSLRFHIIADDEDFEVEGIRVRALAGTSCPPSTPLSGLAGIREDRYSWTAEHGIYFDENHRRPLICLGFMFDESIIYMSDVSSIPESTWTRMLDRRRPSTSGGTRTIAQSNGHEQVPSGKGKVVVPPTPQDTPKRGQSPALGMSSLSISPSLPTNGSHGPHSSESDSDPSTTPQLPILIIDALWPIARHSSHTNLVEALSIALRLKPLITYVVDVVHPVTHFMWEELGRSIRGENGRRQGHPDDAQAEDLIKRWWADEQVSGTDVGERLREWKGMVEPGWDGLVVRVKEGKWQEVTGKKGSTRGWTQASA